MFFRPNSVDSPSGSNQSQFDRITQKTKLPAWVMDSPEMEEIVQECNFIIIVYGFTSKSNDKPPPNREVQCQRHSITQEGNCELPSPSVILNLRPGH